MKSILITYHLIINIKTRLFEHSQKHVFDLFKLMEQAVDLLFVS